MIAKCRLSAVAAFAFGAGLIASCGVEAQTDFYSASARHPRQMIGKDLTNAFLNTRDPTTIEPWKGLLAANTIGTLPPSIPLLIAQGTWDNVVDPPVTAAYVKGLCSAGSRVQTLLFDGVGHGMISRDAAKPSVDWMSDRFSGTQAPSNCGSLP